MINSSSAPVRKLEKFTSFTAEIALGRPVGGSVQEFPRYIVTEGGKAFVKQEDDSVIELPRAVTDGGMATCYKSIMPAASGTNATAIWVGW